MSYLEFEYIKDSPSGKTKVFTVRNVKTSVQIGWITWYAHWRKYVFSISSHEVAFDSSCLKEVAEKLDQINKEHKE